MHPCSVLECVNVRVWVFGANVVLQPDGSWQPPPHPSTWGQSWPATLHSGKKRTYLAYWYNAIEDRSRNGITHDRNAQSALVQTMIACGSRSDRTVGRRSTQERGETEGGHVNEVVMEDTE